MDEVRKLRAVRQVDDALNQRNGPISRVKDLPLNSSVLVWREPGKWTGPYPLLGVDKENCSVDLPSGPTLFRSTVVKPYYESQSQEEPPLAQETQQGELPSQTAPTRRETLTRETLTRETLTRQQPKRQRKAPTRYTNITDTQSYNIEVFIGLNQNQFDQSR